jgi:hypothetical protein
MPFQCGNGRGAEIEPVAHDRLEVVLHQPRLDKRAISEAHQIFSGGCGISGSTTIERVAAISVIGSSSSTGLRGDRTGRARRRRRGLSAILLSGCHTLGQFAHLDAMNFDSLVAAR